MQKQSAETFLAETRERRAKFIALIKEQEAFAKRDPAAYVRKVRWLAYLGYAYVLGILLLLVAITAGLGIALATGHINYGVLKILIFVLPVLYVVARSLYVKLEPPEGVELTRQDAPELFREVDAISQKLGAIKFENIIITDDLNAYASQIPRFGILGPTRNYLVLGLPLLLTLSPDEARSVIAHEFGHFAGGHSRFSGWIYRLNRTWASIQANLDGGAGTWLFQKFFDWFEPLFDATTFALRRQNEFEADAAAVKTVGATAAANALMRYPFVIPHLQKSFWEPLYERAKLEPNPPKEALNALVGVAKSPIQGDIVREKLAEALKEETDYGDTHPSLKDRISAMGIDASNLEELAESLSHGNSQSAAEVLLGKNLDAVVRRVNEHAIQQMAAGWKNYHERFKAMSDELAQLQAHREEMPLTMLEESRFVSLYREVRGDAEARDFGKSALEKFPDSPRLMATYGDILVSLDDEEGVAYLQKAKELEPSYETAAYEAILAFYRRNGHAEKAAEMEDVAINAHIMDAYARQEANSFSVQDHFIPHDVEPGDLVSLSAALAECKSVGEAYLVRKVVKANGERVFTVLILLPKTTLGLEGSNQQDMVDQVAEKVRNVGGFTLYAPTDTKSWRRRLAEVPGSQIYKKA